MSTRSHVCVKFYLEVCAERNKEALRGRCQDESNPRKLLEILRNVRSKAESEKKLKILRQIIGERAEEHSLTKIKKIKNKHLQKSESEVYRNFKDSDALIYTLESS